MEQAVAQSLVFLIHLLRKVPSMVVPSPVVPVPVAPVPGFSLDRQSQGAFGLWQVSSVAQSG